MHSTLLATQPELWPRTIKGDVWNFSCDRCLKHSRSALLSLPFGSMHSLHVSVAQRSTRSRDSDISAFPTCSNVCARDVPGGTIPRQEQGIAVQQVSRGASGQSYASLQEWEGHRQISALVEELVDLRHH
eukprot:4785633-Amphidinium_carterae.1